MAQALLPFQNFQDEILANDFAEKLKENDIYCEVAKSPQFLDSNIIGSASSPGFIIKIRSEDFEKAHIALGNHFETMIEEADKDYYLFNFSDIELLEIIRNQDEWGYFDYQLARKILMEKGLFPDADTIVQWKDERKKVLSKPEKNGDFIYIVGYVLIVAGVFLSRNMLRGESSVFPVGFLLSIFLGNHLIVDKKVLPNGETVFSYSAAVRRHGKAIVTIAAILLVFSFGMWIWLEGNT